MKHVAREKQVPLVDMTTLTKNFTEELGEETTINAYTYQQTARIHRLQVLHVMPHSSLRN